MFPWKVHAKSVRAKDIMTMNVKWPKVGLKRVSRAGPDAGARSGSNMMRCPFSSHALQPPVLPFRPPEQEDIL